MKILIPIGSIYPSQQGGPSNSMYWVASGLHANGEDVTIVSTDVMLADNIPRNVWQSTEYGKVIFLKSKWDYLPANAIKIAMKELPKNDVVHLNSIFYPFSFIIGLMAIWYQKKIVWSVRGELDEKALVYNSFVKKKYLTIFKFLFIKRALFHVTAHEENTYTKAILGKHVNTVVIPNYFILPKIVHATHHTYLSYIGRIHPVKAIENLILACSKSKIFMDSALILKIAGHDQNEYGDMLKNLVVKECLRDKIEFVGHLEGDAKEEFLAHAYFNIMPSHTENFGLVVIEALAQGTPVIASTGSPWRQLEGHQAGFWVDNDVQSLVAIIDKILQLPTDKYIEMRDNAKAYSRNNFDIYKNVGEWLNVYNL